MKNYYANYQTKKLQEIFIHNNSKYKIGLINDNIGIIPFDYILDIILINIIINYIRNIRI